MDGEKMSSQFLGYPNEFAAEPMPTKQMVDLCKEHTLYTWSAGNTVNPLPIARAEGVYLWTPEGQKILAGRDFVPTSRKVDTPLNKVPMKFVDSRVALDEFQKWGKLYADLFTKGVR